jgi:hypothetical protein
MMANNVGKISIDLSDNPELVQMLDQYRVSLGWTWKRTLLISMADLIGKNGDNPNLVVEVADYLGVNK